MLNVGIKLFVYISVQQRTTVQTTESVGATRTDYDEIQQEVIMMRPIETAQVSSGPVPEMPYSRHHIVFHYYFSLRFVKKFNILF